MGTPKSNFKLNRFLYKVLDKILPAPRSLNSYYHRLIFRCKRFVDRILVVLKLKDKEEAEQEEFMLGVELLLKEVFGEVKEKARG